MTGKLKPLKLLNLCVLVHVAILVPRPTGVRLSSPTVLDTISEPQDIGKPGDKLPVPSGDLSRGMTATVMV
jgi:hypothetical protein